MDMTYDVAVIGAGPGGYLAAERAGQAGLSVVLFEQGRLGGTCLNEGCIPSKTLLHSAKLFSYAAGAGEPYGVTARQPALDHAAVLRRKDRVVSTLVGGVAAKLKASGVTVVPSCAAIAGRTAESIQISAGAERYRARRLVIASGSQTLLPPIPGLKEGLAQGGVITSREALSLPQIPEHLIVIGAGVIGLEMASYYRCAGSQVTVVELQDKIAGPMDKDLSALLQRSCQAKGISFCLGAKVTAIDGSAVVYEQNGLQHKLEGSHILVAIGRRAALAGLGLETIQVAHTAQGIEIDDHCHTSAANVYAVGDCTGRILLAHTAYRQAEVAVNHMLGRRDRMDYSAIPSVVYTDPEIAGVGHTEQSAQKAGIPFDTVTLPMAYSGRYLAEHDDGSGLCKLLFHRTKHTLIGAHIAGTPASEIILVCGMMIQQQLTAEEIKRFIFPHPSVCEIIREAVFAYRPAL